MIDEGIFTRKILILDGAIGTMIQRYASENIKTDSNNDRLNLTCREIIASIHRNTRTRERTSETNTFGANRISQLEYGCPELAASMSGKERGSQGRSRTRPRVRQASRPGGRKHGTDRQIVDARPRPDRRTRVLVVR